eukprot:2713366-Amphidinium_carterae.2
MSSSPGGLLLPSSSRMVIEQSISTRCPHTCGVQKRQRQGMGFTTSASHVLSGSSVDHAAR